MHFQYEMALNKISNFSNDKLFGAARMRLNPVLTRAHA